MLILAGLGNPGPRYAGSRHNIGFVALDEIVRRHGFSSWRRRFQGELAEGALGGEKVLALKPMTYMNESGRSVGEAMRFYGLTPDDVIVIHDEIDLAPAKVRAKKGGGIAGHNGLRSIRDHIGTDFHRVRLGVGHPGSKDVVHHHVLNDFAKVDREWVDALVDAVAEAAPLLGSRSFESFQNKVHLALYPPPEKPEKAKAGGRAPDGEAAR